MEWRAVVLLFWTKFTKMSLESEKYETYRVVEGTILGLSVKFIPNPGNRS